MNYKTITYKRIKNLGNYNSQHLEVTVELSEDEDPAVATVELKKFVSDQLQPQPVEQKNEDNYDDNPF